MSSRHTGACTDVAGAAAKTFSLAFSDVGSTIRVRVTATNAYGSSSATSAATGVVAAVSLTLPVRAAFYYAWYPGRSCRLEWVRASLTTRKVPLSEPASRSESRARPASVKSELSSRTLAGWRESASSPAAAIAPA